MAYSNRHQLPEQPDLDYFRRKEVLPQGGYVWEPWHFRRHRYERHARGVTRVCLDCGRKEVAAEPECNGGPHPDSLGARADAAEQQEREALLHLDAMHRMNDIDQLEQMRTGEYRVPIKGEGIAVATERPRGEVTQRVEAGPAPSPRPPDTRAMLVEQARLAMLAVDAYAAYGDSTGWVNFAGNPMPKWEVLPLNIKAAWMAAVARTDSNVRGEIRDALTLLMRQASSEPVEAGHHPKTATQVLREAIDLAREKQ